MQKLIKRQVVTCDRCAFDNVLEASADRVFALDDRYYELNLCEKHADMFDRDIGGWTRLAAEVDNPFGASVESRSKSEYFNQQRRDETRRLRELAERAEQKARAERDAAARAAEIDEEARLQKLIDEDPAERAARRASEEHHARHSIPGAMKWILTEHALDRLELRGYTIRDVLLAASRPQKVFQDPHGQPNVELHERAGCRVVLNMRSFEIITVIDRTKREDTTPVPVFTPERRQAQ